MCLLIFGAAFIVIAAPIVWLIKNENLDDDWNGL